MFRGREIDRRVLTADVDAEVGLITCGATSSSQRVKLSSLIPVSVSGEGVQDGGGVELKEDRAGTPRRDMMCGENVLLGCTQETRRSYLELKPKLEPTRVCVAQVNVRTTQRRLTQNTTQTDRTDKNVRAVRCSVSVSVSVSVWVWMWVLCAGRVPDVCLMCVWCVSGVCLVCVLCVTASTFSHHRQEKYQYRLGENAQSC